MYWWHNLILLKYLHKGTNEELIQRIYIYLSESSNKAPYFHFSTGYLVFDMDSRRTWYTWIHRETWVWHISHWAWLCLNMLVGHQILQYHDLCIFPPPKLSLSPLEIWLVMKCLPWLWLVPAQDGPFFYTRSHLSALQNCAVLFSTKFHIIFILKECITQFSYWIVSCAIFFNILISMTVSENVVGTF